jgi:hypothetical protein
LKQKLSEKIVWEAKRNKKIEAKQSETKRKNWSFVFA